MRDPDALLVAEVDSVVAGTVVAGWDGRRAHLYRLAVHPAQRRNGIGSALLGAAEERLARLGGAAFRRLGARRQPLGAGLWRGAGYRPQADWTRWVKPVAGADGTAPQRG